MTISTSLNKSSSNVRNIPSGEHLVSCIDIMFPKNVAVKQFFEWRPFFTWSWLHKPDFSLIISIRLKVDQSSFFKSVLEN